MSEKTTDLLQWISRVQKANSAKEVFATLNEFRSGPWSPEERARMAKAYIRVLERVGGGTVDESAELLEEKDDGPVWYEKM